jgi:DNA-binding transcriptional ArsR family regulator
MSLLPSRPDASPSDDAGPRVIGVDSEDADDVLSALSSGTARDLLAALHEEPAPPSELADRVDTSLQNAQYHLDKLQRAGAVEVVDTAYSAKGREMDVFAPADQPLVIFAGD